MMDEAGVDRVVIVPPGLNDRNDYALEAAKRYPNRFGVMGRIRLQDPKSAALLPTWKQQPGMLARISHTGDGWHKLQADFAGCGAGATEVGGAQGRGLLFIFSGSSWACW
jgi:hypothetical protein